MLKSISTLFSSLGVIVCLLALVGFAMKNPTMVEVYYYLGHHWRIPVSFLVLSSLLIGLLSGALLCLSPYISQRRRIMALEKELQRLHQPTPR